MTEKHPSLCLLLHKLICILYQKTCFFNVAFIKYLKMFRNNKIIMYTSLAVKDLLLWKTLEEKGMFGIP